MLPPKSRERREEDTTFADALATSELTGSTEFFVPVEKLIGMLRRILEGTTRPVVSINRPQVGGGGMIHSLEWRGLKFHSVSRRPIHVV
ncbi:MAG: hypothetical protein GF400_11695 [Candidatus Eisenbacteria bacterium]|nr:hypothetical protein [Candidatus Eisenbacteria bacterium]